MVCVESWEMNMSTKFIPKPTHYWKSHCLKSIYGARDGKEFYEKVICRSMSNIETSHITFFMFLNGILKVSSLPIIHITDI